MRETAYELAVRYEEEHKDDLCYEGVLVRDTTTDKTGVAILVQNVIVIRWCDIIPRKFTVDEFNVRFVLVSTDS